ncbi:AEC family transporter [candidate division KSB1 bacterium]|nr:AEC family transporter [candidate division KSB1 bacterium]
MEIIIQTTLPVFLLIFSGFILGYYQDVGTRSISNLTIYLLTPALIFTKFLQNPIKIAIIIQIAFFVVGYYFLNILITWFTTRLLRMDKILAHGFTLSIVLFNAGNMGLPFISFAFGDEGLSIAIILLLINVCVTATIGVFIAAGANSKPAQALKQIFLLPNIYAIMIALIIKYLTISVPNFIFEPLNMLGESAIPVSIVLLGIQISRTKILTRSYEIFLASGLRLLIGPLIAFFLTRIINCTELMQKVLIIQTSMPTAIYALLFATKFDAKPDFVSSVILTSTIVSSATLSILLYLLN